ncbi:choline transporter-like protein 1 [Amphiura filiformis]|uniref:choline transporter-like protein 1 n=1 Tax=Amphiura filiformis TaxID=82378 RepID=UPI003B222562
MHYFTICFKNSKSFSFQPGDLVQDDDFDGPLDNRKCRDLPCLVIFLAFWVGMAYVAFLALQTGQPERLFFGADSYGNVCGMKNKEITNITLSGRDMTQNPYVFYFDSSALLQASASKLLCVKSCPTKTLLTLGQIADFTRNTSSKLCDYDIDVDKYESAEQGDMKDCPNTPVLASRVVMNRCFPSDALGTASKLLHTDWIEEAMSDITKSWREICYLSLIALGLSVVVMVLLRYFASFIIWSMVYGFILGSLGGTGYLWYMWWESDKELNEKPVEMRLDQDADNVRALIIYASVASGFTLLILLVILVLRKRIALVAALFKEAGKALGKMPFLMLQPFWALLALGILGVYWVYIYLNILTAGHPMSDDDGYVIYHKDTITKYMWWYHLFGLLWGSQFIIACLLCTIAGAVAQWFFATDKRQLKSPILKSIRRVVRYHLGSMAFGSLIIALVMLARIILGYIQSKLRGSQAQVVQYILKCLQCCLWLFEKVLRFINRNAYIEIAIYGYSFCRAAHKAFSLIVSNVLRVAAINSVGDFILFLGKGAVVASVVVIGLELLKDKPHVHYYAVPIALAAVVAFIISHIFLSVYEMAIDTLFLCFCEDCDRNDGDLKPYYMSTNLMSFVEKAGKAKKAAKRREKARQAQQSV